VFEQQYDTFLERQKNKEEFDHFLQDQVLLCEAIVAVQTKGPSAANDYNLSTLHIKYVLLCLCLMTDLLVM
jgi:hypothetical protein